MITRLFVECVFEWHRNPPNGIRQNYFEWSCRNGIRQRKCLQQFQNSNVVASLGELYPINSRFSGPDERLLAVSCRPFHTGLTYLCSTISVFVSKNHNRRWREKRDSITWKHREQQYGESTRMFGKLSKILRKILAVLKQLLIQDIWCRFHTMGLTNCL